ncbi:hypothetical protein M2405_006162 [Rhodococcus erythropolis]|nr:hypothetical protein [Rhodococcus erythropolis]MCW2425138.1 hypothetical protein [Rhodococcus erythropolis]
MIEDNATRWVWNISTGVIRVGRGGLPSTV